MKSVVTTQAPIPIGPYSQAIKHNGILYLSGNIGFAPGTTKLVDDKDVEKQTHQIFKNIGAILKEAGSGFDKVIKVTVFITDMAHFHAMNGVYQQYFKAPYPARSCVAVKQLPANALVEIECIAAYEEQKK